MNQAGPAMAEPIRLFLALHRACRPRRVILGWPCLQRRLSYLHGDPSHGCGNGGPCAAYCAGLVANVEPNEGKHMVMTRRTNRHQTQWAAQFFAAAELTRRGYLVSFTLGDAPVVDLLAVSPGGTHFQIDVKGLSQRNFWLIRERQVPGDLFYVLVRVPPPATTPEFFIVSGIQVMEQIARLREHTVAQGKPYPESGAGLPWDAVLAYRDRWQDLPQ